MVQRERTDPRAKLHYIQSDAAVAAAAAFVSCFALLRKIEIQKHAALIPNRTVRLLRYQQVELFSYPQSRRFFTLSVSLLRSHSINT